MKIAVRGGSQAPAVTPDGMGADMKDTKRKLTFTTIDGLEIEYAPISWGEYQLGLAGLREECIAEGFVVDRPTYTVTFAGGTIQKFPHDEKSILEGSPEDVEKQKIEWARFQAGESELKSRSNEFLSLMIYEDALKDVSLPQDMSWVDRQKRRHIKVPDEPEALRLHYINTILLKSQADMLDLISAVVAISTGIKEDDIKRVIEGFRDSVRFDRPQPGNGPSGSEVQGIGRVDE